MRFLVCGLGSIGQRHTRNLLALGQRDIIVFRTGRGGNAAFIRDFLDEHPLPVYTDLQEALGSGPDVALISSPSAHHVPMALHAARAGCHLFIEKPLSHSLEGLDELCDEVRHRGLTTYVAYNFRFHPGVLALKRAVETGRIGRPLAVDAQMAEYLPAWHAWEDYRETYAAKRALGGGVILTQSHEIDLLCWMFGAVTRVAAVGGQLSDLDVDVEDVAKILLSFERGLVASVHLDYVTQPIQRHVEVVGTAGRLRWDAVREVVTCTPLGETRNEELMHDGSDADRDQSFRDELAYFVRCLERGTPTMNDLDEARRTLMVALAARQALETGAVVHPAALDRDPGAPD